MTNLLNKWKRYFQIKKVKSQYASFIRSLNGANKIVIAVEHFQDKGDPDYLQIIQSYPIDVIKHSNDFNLIFDKYNKVFYDNLSNHVNLNNEKQTKVCEYFKISLGEFDSLGNMWPKEINDKDYDFLYNSYGYKFIDRIDVNKNFKYLITSRLSFFSNIENNNLKTCSISTYEKEFLDEEVYHNDLNTAIYYGIIFSIRQFHGFASNDYFFKEHLKKEIGKSRIKGSIPLSKEDIIIAIEKIDLNNFDFVDYTYRVSKEKRLKAIEDEYLRVIMKCQTEIQILALIYSILEVPPILIYELS